MQTVAERASRYKLHQLYALRRQFRQIGNSAMVADINLHIAQRIRQIGAQP